MSCSKNLEKKTLEARVSAVEKSYASIKSIKGSFSQHSYLEALNVSETSRGDLLFSKPGKMKWEYKNPEPQQFISDGTTLWFYQPVDTQVIIDNFKAIFRGDIPVSFLLGLGSLSRDFKLTCGCQSSGGIVLDLYPAKKDEGLQSMRLLVNPADNMPAGAEIIDAAGNKNTFILSGLVLDQEIPPSSFKPTFPKNTDIIDHRQK